MMSRGIAVQGRTQPLGIIHHKAYFLSSIGRGNGIWRMAHRSRGSCCVRGDVGDHGWAALEVIWR